MLRKLGTYDRSDGGIGRIRDGDDIRDEGMKKKETGPGTGKTAGQSSGPRRTSGSVELSFRPAMFVLL